MPYALTDSMQMGFHVTAKRSTQLSGWKLPWLRWKKCLVDFIGINDIPGSMSSIVCLAETGVLCFSFFVDIAAISAFCACMSVA